MLMVHCDLFSLLSSTPSIDAFELLSDKIERLDIEENEVREDTIDIEELLPSVESSILDEDREDESSISSAFRNKNVDKCLSKTVFHCHEDIFV